MDNDCWIILFLLLCANGVVSFVPIFGAWGPECDGECLKQGSSYYWCYSHQVSLGWDYCSPFMNVATDGIQCRSNHQCAHHGEHYRWCYTGASSWHYCSSYGTEDLDRVREITRYGRFCQTPCSLSGGHYKCRTVGTNEEDTCSPRHNTITNGGTCKDDHYCDMHGNMLTWYYWCNTDSSWDYCSAIYDCSYSPKPQLGTALLKEGNASVVNETEDRRSSCLKACEKDQLSESFDTTFTVCEVRDFAGRFNVKFKEEVDTSSDSITPQNTNFYHVANVIEAYQTHRIEDTNFRQLNSYETASIHYTAQASHMGRTYAVIRVVRNGSKLSEVLLLMRTTFSARFIRRAMMNCIQRQCRTILTRE